MVLTPKGVTFHPVVVIGLGKNLLFKSVLAQLDADDFIIRIGTYIDCINILIWEAPNCSMYIFSRNFLNCVKRGPIFGNNQLAR